MKSAVILSRAFSITMKRLFSINLYLSLVAGIQLFAPVSFAGPPHIQERAPEFQLPDLLGSEHKLADYRGKVVVLNFWASWCPDCVLEIPSLNKLHGLMKNEDVAIIGVSIDRKRKDIESMPNPILYPVLIDERGDVFVKKYTITRLPVTVIINREGVIVEKLAGRHDFGSAEFVAKIKKLLAEKALQ